MDLTQLIAMIAGTIISLLAEYFPGFSEWYASKTKAQKALLMVGIGAGAALALFGLSCADFLVVVVACTKEGAMTLVEAFFFFMLANQGTYLIARNVHQEPKVVIPEGLGRD